MFNRFYNFHGPLSLFEDNITSSNGGTVSDSIYEALSSDSRITYNSAAIGNFITVSSVDYANVVSAVSATKYVMDDTSLTSGSANWSTGYNVSYNDVGGSAFGNPNPTASIPASNYIIGYAYKTSLSSLATIISYLRTATAANGVHTLISPTHSTYTLRTTSTVYLIRKAPTQSTSQKTYVSFYVSPSAGTLCSVSGKTNYPIYYSSGYNTNTWSSFTGAFPSLQVIATDQRLW